MGMNPDTNRFEKLTALDDILEAEQSSAVADIEKRLNQLVRPDGSPVPKTWTVFKVGEDVVIKGYTFRVAYIGETSILFEPVGPVVVGDSPGEEICDPFKPRMISTKP